MITTIYFHNTRDENYELVDKLAKLGYKNINNILNFGYEVGLTIEIDKECNVKLLKIDGVDVSEKNISM